MAYYHLQVVLIVSLCIPPQAQLCTAFIANAPITLSKPTTHRPTRYGIAPSSPNLNDDTHKEDEEDIPTKESTDPLIRAQRQFERLQKTYDNDSNEYDGVESGENERLYREFLSYSANALKAQLKSYGVPTKGRKPDLARRLVEYVLEQKRERHETTQTIESPPPTNYDPSSEPSEGDPHEPSSTSSPAPSTISTSTIRFASLHLSPHASSTLSNAGFQTPTPVQSAALPLLTDHTRRSLILHAETGTGKTLCYLLPITERMWHQQSRGGDGGGGGGNDRYALVITPTRELAAQVVGVAQALAPPGSVRFISHPTNIVRPSAESKERSDMGRYEFDTKGGTSAGIKLVVGSAKTIFTSLFGDDKLPATPTSKPEAKTFLKNVEYLVLDEVDRLLDVKTSRGSKIKSSRYKKHDKPAAVLASSIARLTLGSAQIVAASATVGRPLRREYARVLGLLPNECPPVVRGDIHDDGGGGDDNADKVVLNKNTLPKSLLHYVMPCDGTTSGGLLTVASFLVKGMQTAGTNAGADNSEEGGANTGPGTRKILFVVTKNCGIPIKQAIGAMSHFGVQPEPKALSDLLGRGEGTDGLVGVHGEVSGVVGLGQSSSFSVKTSNDATRGDSGAGGYVYVMGEDGVRGLHLDGLDSVVIVGRPVDPDGYVHIAGRAGRAGRKGSVVNVVSYEQGTALSSWEKMLGVDFIPLDEGDVASIR